MESNPFVFELPWNLENENPNGSSNLLVGWLTTKARLQMEPGFLKIQYSGENDHSPSVFKSLLHHGKGRLKQIQIAGSL